MVLHSRNLMRESELDEKILNSNVHLAPVGVQPRLEDKLMHCVRYKET